MAVNHEISYFDSIQSNIIVDNKRKIYSYFIEREGASFLKLSFVNIKLPRNAYVEFQYGENAVQREFFHGRDKAVITVPAEKVNIRVNLKKALASDLDSVFSFELSSVEYDNKPRSILSDRSTYMFHQGAEIEEHALAVAACRMSKMGTCSLIGNENYVLTNVDVVGYEDSTYGEIWFNYFKQSCDPESPINEPVRLKPGNILAADHGIDPHEGYVLLSVDEFDYKNSNVKELFGGLKISDKNPPVGEDIYLPRYIHDNPMSILDRSYDSDHPTFIGSFERNGESLYFDGVVSSLAAPIISKSSNELVGMYRRSRHGSDSVGVTAQKLHSALGSFINDNNESVIGLGNVTSFNLEITTLDTLGRLIPINLDKKGVILPFDTVAITDYDRYSLIEVEAIDLITDEVFTLKFKASLVDGDYQTNIHDNNVTGEVFLKIYDFDLARDRLVKFWLAFKVSDSINNIRNYVIRAVLDYYDPHDTALNMSADIEGFTILDLKIVREDELKKSSVSYTIEGDDGYGFVVFDNGYGPTNLVHAEDGYSQVIAFMQNSSGEEALMYLRGVRETDCTARTMNSSIRCASTNKFSRLVLSFHPEDNEHLKSYQDGHYVAVMHLQARLWGNNEIYIDTVQVFVTILFHDPMTDSELENLNPS